MIELDERVLGSDIRFLYDFDLGSGGEGRMVQGVECLLQDTLHAITTPIGSIPWHPGYGMDIYYYIKLPNLPIHRLQLIREVTRTVESDPRVVFGSVRVVIQSWDMNRIKFKVTLTPITESNPVNLVFGWGAYDQEGKVVNQ